MWRQNNTVNNKTILRFFGKEGNIHFTIYYKTNDANCSCWIFISIDQFLCGYIKNLSVLFEEVSGYQKLKDVKINDENESVAIFTPVAIGLLWLIPKIEKQNHVFPAGWQTVDIYIYI